VYYLLLDDVLLALCLPCEFLFNIAIIAYTIAMVYMNQILKLELLYGQMRIFFPAGDKFC